MVYLDDVLLCLLLWHSNRLDDAWRIEDIGEAVENDVWLIDALNLSFVKEGDTLATTHLVKIRRGGNDGDATLLQSTQHLPELLSADRVDTRRRLVKEEDAWTMHQSTRQGEFLFHTSREGTSLAIGKPLYLGIDGTDAVVALLNSSTEEGGKKLQVLTDGQVLIEGETTRHIPYPTTNLRHLPHNVIAVHLSCPLVGKQQGREDAEQSGLACPVRPYQAKHLALTDGERHLVECLHLAV